MARTVANDGRALINYGFNGVKSMKKTILSLLLAVSSLSASAAVINFDDLAGAGDQISGDYAGFNWTNIGTIAQSAYPGTGFEFGAVSPSNSAYNYDGGAVEIASLAGLFDFTGAFFTAGFLDQEISFEGWANGQVVYATGAYVIDTITPLWVQLDWSGIDTVKIYNSNPTYWAMDNFTTVAGAVPGTVPEPGPLALLGLSAAGLLLSRKRKQGAV
jgi:hypothetical protein